MAVLSNTGIRAGASAAGDSGYKIEKSLRFNPDDTAYLSHTPSSSSPAFAQKQFTISFWTKVEGSTSNTLAWCTAGATSGTTGLLQFYIEYGKVTINGNGAYMQSNRRLTDPSAWYHITLAVDTTLSTANDRMKVWVNNERITDWASNTTVGQDASFIWNTNVVHRIGGMYNSSGALGSYLNGYLAEFHSIDGQILDPSSFGETDSTTGKWIPKEYTGTHGPLVNQSQTWSDSVTNPSGAYGVAANAFDGSLTTHASPNYANPMTYTNASPSDTVIQTFEVKCDIYTMTGITVELNDTDITSQLTTTDKWHTITGFTGEQFEKFYWRPTSANYEVKIKAFRINGKILVDDDVTITNNGFYFKFNGSNLGEDSSGQDNNWTANNLTAASTNFNVPCVPFDGTDDYLELADSTDFDFGTSDFTMECFVNPDSPGSDGYQSLVMKADAGTSYAGSSWWWALYSYAAGTSLSYCYIYDGSTYKVLQGSSLPNGKWHHIAVVRDGDTARLYHNGVQVDSISVSGWTMNSCSNTVRIGSDGGGNYDMDGAISNVRIVNGTCLYTNGTTFTVPSRPLENVTNTKLLCCQSSTQASAATVAHTVSGSINTGTGWSDLVKGDLDSVYGTSDRSVPFNGTASNNTSYCIRPQTEGEWLEMDFGSQFNSATSVKIYGQASLQGNVYSGSNENLEINGTAIGATDWYDNSDNLGAGDAGPATFSLSSGLQTLKWGYSSGSQSTGYLYLGGIEVDGTLLKNPLMPSGSMNTFEGATTESDDSTNDDALADTPTDYDDDGNGVGNYCTLNPLDREDTSLALTNGNLQVNRASGSAWKIIRSSIRMDSGAWYWEMDVLDADQNSAMGVCTSDSGGFFAGGTYQDSITYSAFTTGEIWGVAYDADNGTLDYYKNGTIQSGSSETGVPKIGLFAAASIYGPYSSSSNPGFIFNFGQRPFKYTPPTGFKALNTYNLPDPVITEPNKYFDTKLYTGTGASHAITGLNFSPDLVWIKKYTTASHAIFDTVRGVHKRLQSDGVLAVDDDSTTLTAFGTEGFTLSTHDDVNQNTDSYVSWNWDAGTANESGIGSYDGSNFSGNGSVTTNGTLMNTWAKAFDGKTGSYTHGVYSYSDGDTTFTFDTDNKPTWSSKFRIFIRKYAGACYINGSSTDVTDDLSYSGYWEGWLDITSDVGSSGTLSSIKVTDVGSNYVALQAIELDDKILLDTPPSVTVGGLNSTVYDQSKTWSDESHSSTGSVWSAPPSSDSLTAANLFDGSLSTYVGPYSGGTLTVSFGQTFSGTKTYNVYWNAWVNDETIKDQDGNTLYTPASGDVGLYQNKWHEFQGTDVSSLKFTSTTSANASGVYSIKVDGKELIDDDVTVTNVPSIASTYRANPSAGFSIVSYEGNATSGATIAHGLNAKPDFAIFKADETAGYAWYVYHKDIGNTHHLYLNYNSGKNDDSGAWNDTDPDSNVMTLGNAGNVADNNGDMIAYLWSEVEGYSKFGSFAGDGTTDGPFVWCGFRPAWIVFKRTDSSHGWNIYDQKRDPYNEADVSFLYADTTAANTDGDEGAFDMLSNGFKMKGNWNINNASGGTYVFAAFAESPFKYSNAR